MKTKAGIIKICPSCRASFTCNDSDDCWCENARIHRKELIVILGRYNDCICQNCLRKYEEKDV